MKHLLKRGITFICVFCLLLSTFTTPVSALIWDGSSSGGGTTGTTNSASAFTIGYTDNPYRNVCGYRFSVIDINKKTVGKPVDIYNSDWFGWWTGYYKSTTKYNKLDLISRQNNDFETTKNTTYCYEFSSLGCGSTMPQNPSGIGNWACISTNLDPILKKMGINGMDYLYPGDKVLVEPIVYAKLNWSEYSLTVTEMALIGKSICGANSQGNSGGWNYIRWYPNYYFPNLLYTPDGQGLWSGVSALSTLGTFYNIINKGYGVGIAYGVPENANVKYVVKHWQQKLGADPNSHDATNYTLKDTENLTGPANTQVTPAVKSYAGFKSPAKQTVTIAPNSSTVVNYYYTRLNTDELSIEAIEPNSKYRENVSVITSFNVINESDTDITPDYNVSVKFGVYKGGTCIYTATKSDVVIPDSGQNLVYFKWTVPSGLNKAYLTVKGELLVDDFAVNNDSLSVATEPVNDYQTPDTDYEARKPSGWSVTSTPAQSFGSASWSEWIYQNNSLVKKTYEVSLSSSSEAAITPDSRIGSSRKVANVWQMKSGYGFKLDWTPQVTSTGTANATAAMYTDVQTAYALFPEYGYAFGADQCRLLSKVSGSFCFIENVYGNNERLHFIPLWYPNGTKNYTVSVQGIDCWTPAVMISMKDNTNSLTINGSLYDDYFIGRR